MVVNFILITKVCIIADIQEAYHYCKQGNVISRKSVKALSTKITCLALLDV